MPLEISRSTVYERERPSWGVYFLGIARAVAQRADCRRAQYGAVVVKDHRIVSTGYNGASAGQPGCLSGACPRGLLGYDEVAQYSNYDSGPGRCISIHAEQNALIYGDSSKMRGGLIYISNATGDLGKPCPTCAKLIAGAGLTAIYPGLEDRGLSAA